MRYAASLGFAGLISGALSATAISALPPSSDLRLLALFFAPGLVFGLIFAPLLASGGWLRPVGVMLWIFFATLGHAIAATCLTVLSRQLQDVLALAEWVAIVLAAIAAGALGSGILTGATRFLVPGSRVLAPTAVGALLGATVQPLLDAELLGRFVFYMIWQAGYAAALGAALAVARPRVHREPMVPP